MVVDMPAPQVPGTRRASAELEEKEKLRRMNPMLPAASFNVDFGYKSSSIKPGSEPLLDRLGEAITDPSLRGSRYIIVGHTDAAEGREDDLALSEQRAAAVRDYLVKKFGVPPNRLVSLGFGKGRPREPSNPLSSANRRVEIVNVGE